MTRPTVRAGGGVLWRGDAQDPEIAVVHRPRYDDWSLPKGKADPGEHLLVTALREVLEETGFRARIGPYLTTVRYLVTSAGRPATKVVTYWSMRCLGGDFVVSKEVDELRWLTVDAARPLLTSASDQLVLDTFARIRRDTEPLLLLRHVDGSARAPRPDRRSAGGTLSKAGRDQADALVPVLTGLGVEALVSSDLPLCADTLQPYADAAGCAVTQEPRLRAAGFAGREDDAVTCLREGTRTGQVLAVCSEQPVIAGLLAALGRQSGVRPPHDVALAKGGWWLLHHVRGDVQAYERHQPAV